MVRSILLVLYFFIFCSCTNKNSDLKARGNNSSLFHFKQLKECQEIKSDDNRFRGIFSTIYNNREYLPTRIQLDFTKIPSEIFNDSKTYAEIIPWKTVSGKKQYGAQPLRFLFINKENGGLINKAFLDRISQNGFDIAMALGRLDRQKYNNDNFLSYFSLMLVDVGEDWEGVNIKIYSSEVEKKILAEMESLIPPYSGTEESLAGAQKLCEEFDNDVHVPRPTFNIYNDTFLKIKKLFD
jgi:hypothetical protein